MTEHQKNIETWLQNGGDAKKASRLKIPTLENRAKIAYLISKCRIPAKIPVSSEKISGNPRQAADSPGQFPDIPKPSKPKVLGIIAQYPVELHSAYQQAYQLWISVCSLKIQLNAVPADDEKEAFKIQTEMLDKIEAFDRCKAALDHYNENKRVLATETKSDFSDLSPLELLTKRNNLRSLITRRKQTIAKMAAELPEESAADHYKKLSALNRKKEQLQELILDEEKLNGLIK